MSFAALACGYMLPHHAAGSSSRVQSSDTGVFPRDRGRRIALGLPDQRPSYCHWDRIGCSSVLACSRRCLASERWDRLRLD